MINACYKCVRLAGAIIMFFGVLAVWLDYASLGWAVVIFGALAFVVGLTAHWFNE